MPRPLLLGDNAGEGSQLKQTIELINQMQADGVITKYAIGGAVGATFYLEPAATLDVDIFVTLPATGTGQLLSLAPVYEYLQARGCTPKGEHIIVGRFSFCLRLTDLSRRDLTKPCPQNWRGFERG